MKFKQFTCRSFTLVELMAAMAIIAILAGLGVGGMQFVNRRQAEAATRANMAKIQTILEDFKKLKGYYPQQSNKLISTGSSADKCHLRIFYESGESAEANYVSDSGTYKDTDKVFKEYTKLLSSGVIEETTGKDSSGADKNAIKFVDGYGSYFYYKCPGNYNKTSYDLVSAGADGFLEYEAGADDTDDGKKGNSYYKSDGTGNVDNIANWK